MTSIHESLSVAGMGILPDPAQVSAGIMMRHCLPNLRVLA